MEQSCNIEFNNETEQQNISPSERFFLFFFFYNLNKNFFLINLLNKQIIIFYNLFR